MMEAAAAELPHWTPRPRPSRKTHEGRYARLEPLDPARHGDDLFAASNGAEADRLWRYAADGPYRDRDTFETWLARNAAGADPLFFAIIDRATGRAEGRQALMRITPEHGVIEIGHIMFGTALARTRGATEAVYLLASHVFDELRYRRLEWKCDDANVPSKRAALRLGFAFEGVFRQHMVIKNHNRDTAWFSMLDGDWPKRRHAFRLWLAPENFDSHGRQKSKLNALGA